MRSSSLWSPNWTVPLQQIPNPGRTEAFHRLNRAEYRNAVRDLLGLDMDVSALLPPDDVSYGFDNIAGVLKMSPTLMERYLVAAQRVSRLAVGTPQPVANVDYFRIADDLSQESHLPGLPLGTRGGTLISYVFPMDGEYEIRPRLTRDLNEGMPVYTEAQHLEISLDGERVGRFHAARSAGSGGSAQFRKPRIPRCRRFRRSRPAFARARRIARHGTARTKSGICALL